MSGTLRGVAEKWWGRADRVAVPARAPVTCQSAGAITGRRRSVASRLGAVIVAPVDPRHGSTLNENNLVRARAVWCTLADGRWCPLTGEVCRHGGTLRAWAPLTQCNATTSACRCSSAGLVPRRFGRWVGSGCDGLARGLSGGLRASRWRRTAVAITPAHAGPYSRPPSFSAGAKMSEAATGACSWRAASIAPWSRTRSFSAAPLTMQAARSVGSNAVSRRVIRDASPLLYHVADHTCVI